MIGKPKVSIGGLLLFMFITAAYFGGLQWDISIRNWVRTWHLVPDWHFPWGPWVATGIIAAIVAKRLGLEPITFAVLTAISWPLLWIGMSKVFIVLLQTDSQWAHDTAEGRARWIRLELAHWIDRSVVGAIIGLLIGLVARDHRDFVAMTKSGARFLIHSTPVGWMMLAGFLCPTLFLGIDVLVRQLRETLSPDAVSMLDSVPRFYVVRGIYPWMSSSILGLLIGVAVGCLFWAYQHRTQNKIARQAPSSGD